MSTFRWWARTVIWGALADYAPTSRPQDLSALCQADGWNMSRELTIYAGNRHSVAGAAGTSTATVLEVDTLYAVSLRPQSQVRFVQESPNAPRVAASMAGLTRFTVRSTGRYRVTVDTALWIDAVNDAGIVPPSGYITWHQCPTFRKSVDYKFQAGQSIVLQFSGASEASTKVSIEPVME